MSVNVRDGLPVIEKLRAEGIEVNAGKPATKQIIILNLMPKKEDTELQLLRLLGASQSSVEVTLLHTASYQSKNVSAEYLNNYYKVFEDIRNHYFDGLIITGAPIEFMAFEDVAYYDELIEILAWSQTHVKKRYFICWAAQFALHHYFDIEKSVLPEKLFGIYDYQTTTDHPYTKGFGKSYVIPESRHTEVNIQEREHLLPLSDHPILGPDILTDTRNGDLYVLGHLEYDRDTLAQEYYRDINKGHDIDVPRNYFPEDDPSQEPTFTWQPYAKLLMKNWLEN